MPWKEKLIGIYQIVNKINNKRYIGSSNHIKERWKQHKGLLKTNRHPNTYLQASWNKYGMDNFQFEILELCDVNDKQRKEQFYIDKYMSYLRIYGYNLERYVNFYSSRSQETKDKISKANSGRKRTAEQLARAREVNFYRNKTHCPKGHPYSGDNLTIDSRGYRICNICRKEEKKRYYIRHAIKKYGSLENSSSQMGRFNRNKTHCPRGHLYDDENTYFYRNQRKCKECMRQRDIARRKGK